MLLIGFIRDLLGSEACAGLLTLPKAQDQMALRSR